MNNINTERSSLCENYVPTTGTTTISKTSAGAAPAPVFNPTLDISNIMLAMTQIYRKLHIQEYENAMRQQQISLQQQEQAYAKRQASIASTEKAATITATLSGVGAGIGLIGGGLKATSAVKTSNTGKKLKKVEQKVIADGIKPEDAFAKIEQTSPEKRNVFKKLSDKFGSTPKNLEGLERKHEKWTKRGGITDLAGAIGGAFSPIGQGIASTHTAAAQAETVDADRAKTLQEVNDRQSDTGKQRAAEFLRTASDMLKSNADLYAKMITAVRF